MSTPLQAVWSAIKRPVRWLLALLILFEEWGWTPLARALASLARRAGVRRLERRIEGLGPRIAFAVLFVPALALLPIKIGALWLVGVGRVAVGIAILLAAKILGTAVVARLFMLTQPQLMRLGWFARAYVRWIAWKTRVVASLLDSSGWRAGRALAARARSFWTR